MSAILAFSLGVLAPGAQASWTLLEPPTKPSARRSTGAVTEQLADRDRIWIFGGFTSAGLSDALWYYDTALANWVLEGTSGAVRERHMLGFVPRCSMVVIFGGNSRLLPVTLVNDLRTYDTVAQVWRTHSAAGTWPTARSDAAFQYSPERDRLILFGGMRGNLSQYINELWELDLGADCQSPVWSDRSAAQTSPPAIRAAMCSAYVPTLQQLIVFGGENSSPLGDTHRLDPATAAWSVVPSGTGDPSARSWMPCVYDAARGVIALHGGYDTTFLGGTSLLATGPLQWASVAEDPHPGVISDHSASYSPRLGGMLQFGGQMSSGSYVNSTWLYQVPVTFDAGISDATQPDTTQPDTAQPDTAQPDTAQPDTAQPDTAQPDTAQPDTTQPDTTQPDTTQPDAGPPDSGVPDAQAHDRSGDDLLPFPDASADTGTCVPRGLDDNCDGVDDDCNGVADDAYQPVATTCGIGACAGNTGLPTCVNGVELDSCDPLAGATADDAICDGADSDCDGLVDEDALLNEVCQALVTSPCEIAVCDPQAGHCVSSRLSGCCEVDADCTSASLCVLGACDSATQRCGYQLPEACCGGDLDCNDANACTVDRCDVTRGACVLEPIAHCCTSDADCDDGDPCTLDRCSSVNRCLHQPTACAVGPCDDDPSCTFSRLFLATGPRSPRSVVLAGPAATPVWQLRWESEAIASRLTTLRVWLDGFRGSDPEGSRPRFALHRDADGDGALDPDSVPLAVTPPVPLGQGQLTFTAVDLELPAAASGHLLIVSWFEEPTAAGCRSLRASRASPAMAALVLLAAVLWRRRRDLRGPASWPAARALLLAGALALAIGAACLRAGFYELRQGALELRSSADLSFELAAGERLWVQALPLRSAGIQIVH